MVKLKIRWNKIAKAYFESMYLQLLVLFCGTVSIVYFVLETYSSLLRPHAVNKLRITQYVCLNNFILSVMN